MTEHLRYSYLFIHTEIICPNTSKLQDYGKVVVNRNTPSSKGPFTAAAMVTSSMAYSGGNASIMALGMEMLQSANVIQSN